MLPFRVGQEVEAKSFEEGYRSAWFRCRIMKIFTKDEDIWYDLEYFDFDGEAITPTKAYQFARHVGGKRHLMIRPKFPTCYNTSFWTGTITGILGNGEVKLKLIRPPVGQGGLATALTKNLRPNLSWSLENGWTVHSPRCAKLIKPPTNGPQPSCSNINGSLEEESLPPGKHNHEDDPSERKEIRVDDEKDERPCKTIDAFCEKFSSLLEVR
ncbi:hypothetical protein MLD38_011971 [Melastoma candidum]|uniref:Uncharacterized protein n=1 Tax=Melastoma candidum TaxID=119954 RepID=A0ACB9R5W4_9MYRT|nr:hypothetical protein MLD38_011971 [Melastoma candidum]